MQGQFLIFFQLHLLLRKHVTIWDGIDKICQPCTCLDSNDIIHRSGIWQMTQHGTTWLTLFVCLNLNLVKMLHANMCYLRGYRQHSHWIQSQPVEIRNLHSCCPWSMAHHCKFTNPGSLPVVCPVSVSSSMVSSSWVCLLITSYSVNIGSWGCNHHHQRCYIC